MPTQFPHITRPPSTNRDDEPRSHHRRRLPQRHPQRPLQSNNTTSPLPSIYGDVAPATDVAVSPPAQEEITPAVTLPSEDTPSTANPPSSRQPRHGQRKRRPPKHLAAAVTTADNANTSLDFDSPHQWAFHGTAVNPDTGHVAEYDELSKCSEGAQWIQSNTEEWGRLAQGLGPDSEMPTGTNTIYFIRPSDMPHGRTARKSKPKTIPPHSRRRPCRLPGQHQH